MKIILSRKGFDSSSGKQANPIMPDGTLLSLPIPDEEDANTFSSLHWEGNSYFDIIHSLNPKTFITSDSRCHLDPDLRFDVKNRETNWKPAFGQMNASLSHLRNQNVSVGDIFLFYGWFRETELKDGRFRYKKYGIDAHIIYGYMQIGEIIEHKEDVPDWLKDHPHFAYDNAWKASKERYNHMPARTWSVQQKAARSVQPCPSSSLSYPACFSCFTTLFRNYSPLGIIPENRLVLPLQKTQWNPY